MTGASPSGLESDRYRAFGLTFQSCLPLPARPAARGTAPDVCISYGTVPCELAHAVSRRGRHQAAPHEWLLAIEGIARYLVTEGRTIIIDRHASAMDADVLLFLLGSALGALLHQRHDLVLHGSAIEAHGGAFVFLGLSGSGKSTVAAALRQRGYRVLTDDVCVVRAGARGVLEAQPGLPQLKLWADALATLEIPAQPLPRVGAGLDKRAMRVRSGFATRARPLTRLYILQPAETAHVELAPLSGSRKFTVLLEHTYRFSYLEGLGTRATHFQHAIDVARSMPIVVVSRPRESCAIDELIDRLVSDFAA